MKWSGELDYHIGRSKWKRGTAGLVPRLQQLAAAAVCRQISFISGTECPALPSTVHDDRRKSGAKDDYGTENDGVGFRVIEINLIWFTVIEILIFLEKCKYFERILQLIGDSVEV